MLAGNARSTDYALAVPTKTGNWQHCAVARGDLHRAASEAFERVGEWSGYGATSDTSVTFRSGLSETSDDPDAVAHLHRGDLPEIAQIRITIRGDRDARWREQERVRNEWYAAQGAAIKRGELPTNDEPPDAAPMEDASVTLSMPWAGRALMLEVEGPDRAAVEGLFQRLSELVTRRQSFRRIGPHEVVPTVAVPLGFGLLVLGTLVPRWIDSSLDNHRVDWQEVVGMLAGVVLAAAVVAVVLWLYPATQLLEDGERSRAERFRGLVVAALAALVLGVVASILYGAFQ